MSILIKKINKKEYAYLAYRVGGKVVQQYLGPASSEKVAAKLSALKEIKSIPEAFRVLFWDTDSSGIDIKKNSAYIIERVLEMGDLKAAEWLQRLYPGHQIIDVLERSRKLSKKSRNFWQLWFGVAR